MKAKEVTFYGFFALAMVLLGRYELRTDDSGMVAFFILLIAFTSLHPSLVAPATTIVMVPFRLVCARCRDVSR